MEYKFTTENFQAEVLESKVPVLVDFYADWCGPCKMMAPIIAKLAETFEGKMKIGKCNVDDNMDLAEQYRITNIPCMIVFKDGAVAETFIGARSEAMLKADLEKLVG